MAILDIVIVGQQDAKRGFLIPENVDSSFQKTWIPHSRKRGFLILENVDSSFQKTWIPHSRKRGFLIL